MTCEVGSVVGDDGVGHAESVNNVQEELDASLESIVLIGFASIHLLNFVNCDK
jgi:hypothetical protein